MYIPSCSYGESEPPTGIKVRKMSSTQNSSSPQVELPMPGPSSVLTEGEKLIKLMEMFPSHSDILNDALAYYKDSKFDARKKLHVVYKRQPAADTGGVTCQIYTQLLQDISQQFFYGDTFKTPIYNSNMVDSGNMILVGAVITHSILQGWPGFPLFSPSVYHYLATGDFDAAVHTISVNDCTVSTKHFILTRQVHFW